MKKKVLFVIESLACAGGEKSLITLLNLFDYDKYDVDLQLFKYGGELETLLPKEVHLLPNLRYFSETYVSLTQQIRSVLHGNFSLAILLARLRYSIKIRFHHWGSFQQAVEFWKSAKRCFPVTAKHYDVAVAYAQGIPTYYVADCVDASHKVAWINAIYQPEGKYRDFSSAEYRKFDRISCVSDRARDDFVKCFPFFFGNTFVTKDINDGNMIAKMASVASSAPSEMDFHGLKLLTVGRFAWPKGYDIAVDACKILKDRGFDFRWYILGKGPFEQSIRAQMQTNGVTDRMILLGTRSNPYPYFCRSDIYVQTSRVEGFGLTIAEARTLNIPVVTTRFDAVFAQMVEGENGLVVDIDPISVADGIQRLIEDQALYRHIVAYEKNETKTNYEELEKFYRLIEDEN